MKNKYLIVIFLLALFLRLYKLGTFPFGFHVDEVKVGWNALSILKTGADDRGNKLALYYNSFGDFRPTGIFYATIPSVALFGRNEFAVRFPSALLGALTIFPLYFFVKQLQKNKEGIDLALISSLLLAVSPWHISTSRATSEVVISMFLVLTGLWLFIKWFSSPKIKYLISSIILMASSYFFYHTARLLVPAFVGVICVYYWQEIKKAKLTRTALVVFGIVTLLTGIFAMDKRARSRFTQVSIVNDLNVQFELTRMPFEEGQGKIFIARFFHNKPLVYARRFVNEYANYFSANFFLNPQTAKPDRYMTTGMGILTYVELALLVFGLIALAQKKFFILPLLLLLVSPIPSSLTLEDTPNLHRALYMVPFICIISSLGINYLIGLYPKFSKQIKYIVLFLLGCNYFFYSHMYYVHNKVHLPLYRNIGAKEVALELDKIQGNYDKIILTNIPDDLYPWIAFLTNRDPKIFNKDAVTRDKGTWTSENFVFTGQRCPSRDAFEKPDVKRLLVIDAEGCAKESNLNNRTDVKIIKTIKRPDETEVYTLWSKTE